MVLDLHCKCWGSCVHLHYAESYPISRKKCGNAQLSFEIKNPVCWKLTVSDPTCSSSELLPSILTEFSLLELAPAWRLGAIEGSVPTLPKPLDMDGSNTPYIPTPLEFHMNLIRDDARKRLCE
jgi:hypothetical protein